MPLGTHTQGHDAHANRNRRVGGPERPPATTPSADRSGDRDDGLRHGRPIRHECAHATTTRARTVLVVDDDPAIREFLTMTLEDVGYRVQTAGSGREALDKVRRDPPDVVLLDLEMPRTDGWSFLASRRTASSECRTPVLAMSAMGGKYMARELGARDFIAKPLDLDSLLGKVAALC